LAEVRGQGAEVGAVHRTAIEEVALVPVGDTQPEVGGQDREVGTVDGAVEIRVAKQRVLQFDLAAGETGDGVGTVVSVGPADAVFQVIHGRLGSAGNDSVRSVPGTVVEAGLQITKDRGDGIAAAIIDEEVVVGDVQRAAGYGEASDLTGPAASRECCQAACEVELTGARDLSEGDRPASGLGDCDAGVESHRTGNIQRRSRRNIQCRIAGERRWQLNGMGAFLHGNPGTATGSLERQAAGTVYQVEIGRASCRERVYACV